MRGGKGQFYSSCVLFFRVHGKATTVTYRHLASLLRNKWNSSYFMIIGWLCCSFSFSLLCSSLMHLHGSCSSSGSSGVPVAVNLTVAEGRLATNDV